MLFALALTIALTLIVLVFVVPLVPLQLRQSAPRLVRIFGEDLIIQRTAIACALGLFFSAFVFFRNQNHSESEELTNDPNKRRRSRSNTVGA